MSNQRLPRWLSEGISEFEETIERPGRWGRAGDLMFANLMNRGETSLKELNAAFQSPQLIGVGYYQASLVVKHIVERFGHEASRRLVSVHAKGMDDESGLKAALNVDFDDLQASFDKAMKNGSARCGRRLPPSGDAELFKMLIEALQALAERIPTASPCTCSSVRRCAGITTSMGRLAFERAAELVPMATGDENPHLQIAQIAIERAICRGRLRHSKR